MAQGVQLNAEGTQVQIVRGPQTNVPRIAVKHSRFKPTFSRIVGQNPHVYQSKATRPMKRRTLLPTLATLAIGTLLPLAACSESPRTDQASSASQSNDAGNGGSGAPVETSPTATAATAGLVPEDRERSVTVTQVLSGDTVVVQPRDETDLLYGTDITVKLKDLKAPAKGECGFDAATTYAKSFFEGNQTWLDYDKDTPINADGQVNGFLRTSGLEPIREGYALPTAENPRGKTADETAQRAQKAKAGLYKTCPDFGK